MSKNRDPWWGRLRRQIEVTCYQCGFELTFANANQARREGWRRIKRFWHCRRCASDTPTLDEGGSQP